MAEMMRFLRCHCYSVMGASSTRPLINRQHIFNICCKNWFFSEPPDHKNWLFSEPPTVYQRKRVALYVFSVC